jgi:uncharacterized protein (TIGR00251 family)
MSHGCAQVAPGGTWLRVKVTPRASKNEVAGPSGDELKVRLTAPPVDNTANQMLVKFLAEAFHCAPRRVQVVRGHTSRHKTVYIEGLAPTQTLALLGVG